jgi:hypothetical protein
VSTVPTIHPDPLVAAALELLAAFYVDTRRDAAVILNSWRRRHELSPAQIKTILDHYPSRGPR